MSLGLQNDTLAVVKIRAETIAAEKSILSFDSVDLRFHFSQLVAKTRHGPAIKFIHHFNQPRQRTLIGKFLTAISVKKADRCETHVVSLGGSTAVIDR